MDRNVVRKLKSILEPNSCCNSFNLARISHQQSFSEVEAPGMKS
jgi:hypothetical protein